MTAAVVVAATVLLAECALHATASITPQPTTYRPSWSTASHAATPTAATHEEGQPAGGRKSGIREQPLNPSSRRPLQAASSGAASPLERMVLREEVYEGETRLVYRLAPGAVFAGIRTPLLHGFPDAGRLDLRDAGGAKPPRKYPGRQENELKTPLKPIHKPSVSVGTGWTATRPDVESLKQQRPAPRRPPRRWAPLSNLRSQLATLSTAGLGYLRSFRLIFMILQYLGFIPPLPGFPKYEDPDYRRPSTKYTLDRGKA